VGIHGAGLTNIMFMKPGGTLVEITGEFDGRMAPGGLTLYDNVI